MVLKASGITERGPFEAVFAALDKTSFEVIGPAKPWLLAGKRQRDEPRE